ncbi:ParB N-terminal domain-containing protein [Haloarcula sebkhae]|uniref:ParB-like N-terminal domain-containing protein n=2 Tax=Haloarcula sebkhae TaxID=932660 RepID=A0A830F244_9EURY|nr:ParB N-terminal domain-containing protein [Haloarcula sebkhae]GGK74267.1 hypothetical protein GCM10009067_28070 [Haloarcula sebkhae]
MTNPLFDALDTHMRGERVRVVGNDGTTYEGWCERIHHHDRHVLLQDAVNVDRDGDVGTAYVAHCDSIEVLTADRRIENIRLDAVEPAPYAVREFDREGNCGYIASVRDDGWVGSFPVVRPVDGDPGVEGFEVVEGHKRLWVAREAGLDTHPVEVINIDDWELAWRFAVDHLPDEEQVHDDGTASGCYTDGQIETVIQQFVEEFGDDAADLPRVAFNAERLGIDVVGADFIEQTGSPTDGVPDEATDAEVEAAVDDDRDDADGDLSLTPTAEEVVDALREHGELPSADLKYITQRSHQGVSSNLSDLEDMGRVESRPDPDDGRRQLYSLVDDADGDGETQSEQDEHHVGDPINEDGAGAQETEADGGVTADSESDLPPGLTAQDVRDAVDAAAGQQASSHVYLDDVADELNVRPPRARLFTVEVGVYHRITDASGPKGGDD